MAFRRQAANQRSLDWGVIDCIMRLSQVGLHLSRDVTSAWQTPTTPENAPLHQRRDNYQSRLLHGSRDQCKYANFLISQAVMLVGTGIAVTPTCAPSVDGALIQQQSVQAAMGDHHLQRRAGLELPCSQLSWTVCLVFMHLNNVYGLIVVSLFFHNSKITFL